MRETLLVKHAVGGRTFIDTSRIPVEYAVDILGDAWVFSVSIPLDAVAEEILKWKEELNVFLFHECDDQPTRKTWFYVKDGPVNYDVQQQKLFITAQSRIEYVPDKFHAPL